VRLTLAKTTQKITVDSVNSTTVTTTNEEAESESVDISDGTEETNEKSGKRKRSNNDGEVYNPPLKKQKGAQNQELKSTVDQKTVVLRKFKVAFAPHLPQNECLCYIDEGGVHGVPVE